MPELDPTAVVICFYLFASAFFIAGGIAEFRAARRHRRAALRLMEYVAAYYRHNKETIEELEATK